MTIENEFDDRNECRQQAAAVGIRNQSVFPRDSGNNRRVRHGGPIDLNVAVRHLVKRIMGYDRETRYAASRKRSVDTCNFSRKHVLHVVYIAHAERERIVCLQRRFLEPA